MPSYGRDVTQDRHPDFTARINGAKYFPVQDYTMHWMRFPSPPHHPALVIEDGEGGFVRATVNVEGVDLAAGYSSAATT